MEIEAKRLWCELRASKKSVAEIQAEVEYEKSNGESADGSRCEVEGVEPYLPMEMKQPEEM